MKIVHVFTTNTYLNEQAMQILSLMNSNNILVWPANSHLILPRSFNGRFSNRQTGTFVEIRFIFFSSHPLCYLIISILVFGGIVVYYLRLPPLRDGFFMPWLALPLGRSDNLQQTIFRNYNDL